MKTRKVTVVPYDCSWRKDFADRKEEIEQALGELAAGIEHVGSTAVEGLSAKPIIDIDVVIKNYAVFESVAEALGKAGYFHEGNLGIPGREAFGYEGKEHLRNHHLYVCPEDSSELKRHIAFRDYLRSHPEKVVEYSRIKKEAAELFSYDIEKYIEYKSPFIEGIYRELGL